jgi:hypothetical protein
MADPIALLSEPVELPCGLKLPNRLAKVNDPLWYRLKRDL